MCVPPRSRIGCATKKHHGDRAIHVECLGFRDWWPELQAPSPWGAECSSSRGRVPCGGWRVSRRLSHSFEGRLIDTSDHYFDDSRDDPFVRSANDNDDDRWHYTCRSLTARFRMGRELKRVATERPQSYVRSESTEVSEAAQATEAGRVQGLHTSIAVSGT